MEKSRTQSLNHAAYLMLAITSTTAVSGSFAVISWLVRHVGYVIMHLLTKC